MHLYVSSYIVQAEPALKNGRAGYDVYYPDGRVHWLPEGDFELHHRLLDARERMLVEQTTLEQGVARISDKDDPP